MIYNEEKWILGGCSGRMITTPSSYCGDGFIADVDTLANAQHIVKSVNFHDELFEALKYARNLIPAQNSRNATAIDQLDDLIKRLEKEASNDN